MASVACVPLRQIAWVFLRIGATGFGGPIALVSLIEHEACRRRAWLSPEEFQRSYVLCKLLPGPLAFQMALSVGRSSAGTLGGLVAGVGLILPSFLMMLGFAAWYSRGSLAPITVAFIEGMRVGSLAVIVESVAGMWRPYARDPVAAAFGAAALVLFLRFPHLEPLWIVGAGLVAVCGPRAVAGRVGCLASPALGLLWTHFKAGAVVFGTGLAVVPYLQAKVTAAGWLTHQQFLDGLALAQVTPGPITTLSAFIGYKVAGLTGGIAAAIGMYLPGVILVLGLLPWLLRRSEGSPWLQRFQRGALPAVIGCILGASLGLAPSALGSAFAAVLFAMLIVATWLLSPPGWLVIILGGVVWVAL